MAARAAILARALLLACACSCVAPAIGRDLALGEAEQRLLERNRDIIAARRATELASAQVIAAGARPNPTVSINQASYSPSTGIGGGPVYDKRIDTIVRLDQVIERGGKRDLRIETARGLQRAAQTDVLDVIRQQRAVLATAYYELKLARDRIGLLREQEALFGRTLSAAQTRLKAGDIAAADVAKVEVDFERARNDARTAEAELARAQVALGVLIADEANAASLRAIDEWPRVSARELPPVESVIDARPDIAAARARAWQPRRTRASSPRASACAT